VCWKRATRGAPRKGNRATGASCWHLPTRRIALIVSNSMSSRKLEGRDGYPVGPAS
jgi:hypothetical protein